MAVQELGHIDLVGALDDRIGIVDHDQPFAGGAAGEAIGVVVDRSRFANEQGVERGDLLDVVPALPRSVNLSAKDMLLKITGVDLSRCPCCHDGTMITVGDLPASSSLPRWDSS